MKADPGIYRIRNTVTGDCYVGRSTHVKQRWSEHRWALKSGTHHSQALQHAWNTYGAACFEFTVLSRETTIMPWGASGYGLHSPELEIMREYRQAGILLYNDPLLYFETRASISEYRPPRKLQPHERNKKPSQPPATCKHGHEYTPENTYITPSTGWRICRLCTNRRAAQRYAKLKASREAEKPRKRRRYRRRAIAP